MTGIKIETAAALGKEYLTSDRTAVHVGIEDGEKDRDALHPALEELLLFNLIHMSHRPVGWRNSKGSVIWRFAFRITEEPETEKK
jgi:hypothetical protein